MSMNDEQFEATMDSLRDELASRLRARDTAQREALARLEAERDELARCIELHDTIDAGIAQAQLAEAVGVIQNIAQTLEGQEDCRSMRQAQSLRKFLARHAQAERQCQMCEPAGVFATDGTGPYDCYECGKKAEQQEAPPGWSPCSPDLLKSGVCCESAPRIAGRHGSGVSHYHPAPKQEAQGAQAGDERAVFEDWVTKDQCLTTGNSRILAFRRDKNDEYINEWVEERWFTWKARAALATQPADERAREMGYRSAINALDDLDRYKMAMSPATAVPEATQQQLNDLHNFFNSVCEGGLHSVEKSGIQSLTELGALENCGFGKHRLTRFGTYLLDQPAVRGAEHE